jgi:DNA polymerase-1
MKKKTLLLDGDTYLYRIACGAQRRYDWGNGVISNYANLSHAKDRLDAQLYALAERLHATDIIVALTDELNWRHEVYPAYKENRKGVARPMLWQDLRDHFLENYRTFKRPLLEGDDILGILATHPRLVTGKKIMVGIDKDLLTIPCHHYNPVTEIHTVVDEDEAAYNHLFQTLTGDTIDGYPGCPRIGKIRAKRILGQHNTDFYIKFGHLNPSGFDLYEAWTRVVDAYCFAGLTEDYALVQARVARILHAHEYDMKTKEPKLWQIPSPS